MEIFIGGLPILFYFSLVKTQLYCGLFLEFEVVVIYSFMCKFLPKIGFLCNVIFVNNSEFKCFVRRKIWGFGYF